MKKLVFLLFVIVLSSCAKLPVHTITLTEAVIDEGKRMHELNLVLINKMFAEKRDKIDIFIKNEYTPKFLEEFRSRIPEGTNYEEEFPNMIESIIPKINSRRDMMQSALENQRIKIITKMNADYKAFEEASMELKSLVESAVKVNEERKKAFQKVKGLTGNKIDLNQIETELDEFIIKSGDVSGNINNLNNSINSLLNK